MTTTTGSDPLPVDVLPSPWMGKTAPRAPRAPRRPQHPSYEYWNVFEACWVVVKAALRAAVD